MSITYLLLCTSQSCLVYTYLSQELSSPIFTMSSLQYFFICFPLAFLDGYHLVLFSEEILTISLYLISVIWKILVPSISTESLIRTLSQSFFQYSSFFLFFFFFLCCLHLSSSYTLDLVAFLAFYTTYLKQQASTTSSRQAQSFCFFLYYCHISQHCCYRILILASKRFDRAGNDMIVQEKGQKFFFFFLCIINLDTIMSSCGKLNRTSKAQF